VTTSNDDIAPPETVAELLDLIETTWEALGTSIAGLSAERQTQRGPQGWSVADHLAHIAEWERATTFVVQRRPQSEAFGVDPDAFARLDTDGLNDIVYRRHRGAPLEDVLDLSRRAHAELLEALRGLDDADLQRAMADFGGPPGDQRPLLPKIAGDTYQHYPDHQAWIADLLAALA
jgi:hypothetical protein